MTKAPYHSWQQYANQHLDWFGTDSQDAYHKHLSNSDTRQRIKSAHWLDANITYQFNEHGFRSDNFDQGPGFVALGCSHTQGVGLPYNSMWATIVARALEIQSWNLGIAGGSMDTCFRLAQYWLPKLKPKFVVILEPRYRVEIHRKKIIESISLATDERVAECWYLKEFATNEENSHNNQLKNRFAIQAICTELQIPLYHWTTDTWQQQPMDSVGESYDEARDLAHPGVRHNKNFANMILRTVDQDIKPTK